MKEIDKIRTAIDIWHQRYGFNNSPVITIGYSQWQSCLKEIQSITNFGSVVNLAIDTNSFICCGCKVIWSHALKNKELFIGVEL